MQTACKHPASRSGLQHSMLVTDDDALPLSMC